MYIYIYIYIYIFVYIYEIPSPGMQRPEASEHQFFSKFRTKGRSEPWLGFRGFVGDEILPSYIGIINKPLPGDSK